MTTTSAEARREQAPPIVEWNSTETHYRRESLHVLFEEQVTRTPRAIAVAFGAESLSYAELNERANRVAHRLRSLGVGPDALVGICMDRSLELIAALLGALKAGGAYVPMDPQYPRERLGYILADAKVRWLLTTPERAGLLQFEGSVVVPDAPAPDADGRAPPNPAVELSSDNLAYVIYTSGSTGKPKGVAITHRNAANLVGWALEAFSRDEMAGVLASTSICFDLSIFEIFATLASGGTLLLVENALALPSSPLRDRVSMINTVPSAMDALMEAGPLPPRVRTVNVAGEALTQALADRVAAQPNVTRLWNLYGPTETTTYSSSSLVKPGTTPTLGRPLSNTQIYILDQDLRLVPADVAGEIWIGGDGVARGYVGRPELTAERFLPDPFSRIPGARMYRTGDLGKQTGGGEVEYLGRSDHQVKIRGFRIELGEIETVIAGFAGVRACAVLVREDAPGEKRLAAYVSGSADVPELRAHLATLLPSHMLPTAFVSLESLPLTPNGKIDRKALHGLGAPSDSSRPALAPRDETERAVAEIFGRLLGQTSVGVHDDFFDLGGTSLLVMRLRAQINTRLGVSLSIKAIVEKPTVSGIAALIGASNVAGEAAREAPGEGPPRPAPGRTSGLRRLGAKAPSTTAPSDPCPVGVPRGASMPVAHGEERWLSPGARAAGGGVRAVALRAVGPLNPAALHRSVQEVVRRHEALRTTFHRADGGVVQRIGEPGAVALRVVEVPRESLEAHMTEEASSGFDLGAGPPFRATLFRSGADHFLVLAAHAMVSDDLSMTIVVNEMAALYARYASGEESDLEEPALHYADYASWQRRWLEGGEASKQLAYWSSKLAGLEASSTDGDRRRPATRTTATGLHRFRIDRAVADGARELGRREGVSLFVVLLSAWEALSSRVCGHEMFAVGAHVANRSRPGTAGIVGPLANILALRSDASAEVTFPQLLHRVRETTLEALANQEVPLQMVADALNAASGAAPFVKSVLVVHELEENPAELRAAGISFSRVALPAMSSSPFDLTLTVTEDGDELDGSLRYDEDLVEPGEAARLVEGFVALLRVALRSPDVVLSALDPRPS